MWKNVNHDKLFSSLLTDSTHIYGMQHNLRLFQKTFSGYKHWEKKRVISLCRKRSTNPYKKTVHSLRLARPWLILTPPPPPPPCMISLLLYLIILWSLICSPKIKLQYALSWISIFHCLWVNENIASCTRRDARITLVTCAALIGSYLILSSAAQQKSGFPFLKPRKNLRLYTLLS